jgi:hypothetical protein
MSTTLLAHLTKKCQQKWSIREKSIASVLLKNLNEGTKTKLHKSLPSITVRNAKSAIRNGEIMTDTIATWVKKRFVAGPFDTPPTPNFRANMLMAKEETTKVRPILNLSAPIGASFNDAVCVNALRKLTMCSPNIFGQALLKAGVNATFTKLDVSDAYKLIPCSPQDWHFYGIKWLGKFFHETQTAFGNKAAPAQFDDLMETVTLITRTLAKTPKQWVFRQLDDTICLSPAHTNYAEKFAETFRAVCRQVRIPLAPEDPNFEKAFGLSQQGTVLGIIFNSTNLTWKLPPKKHTETLALLHAVLTSNTCTLLQFQRLHGKLNDFGQMCTFLKAFRFHQTAFLQQWASTTSTVIPLPPQLKTELAIWGKCLLYAKDGFPIPRHSITPPLFPLTFVSDAAGAVRGAQTNKDSTPIPFSDRGVASLGFEDDQYFFVSILRWPHIFLTKFPSNSTLLESIGLLLPFLCIPQQLTGRHILLLVDNEAVVYAWTRRLSPHSEWVSIIIQTLHIMEAALPCRIYVQHVPRCSTGPATLADALSRETTTTPPQSAKIMHLPICEPQGPLLSWLQSPIPDWTLPIKLVEYILSL